jgi:diaminohydroxyphosphoribosylaminopyrimidine deaminase/5-amino-6-(5-phosphoribosylamino)uracil reductase
VKTVKITDEDNFISEILTSLHTMEIQSLLVEGGAFIMKGFLETGLWDEARRFTGDVSFGGGVPDPFPEFMPEKTVRFEKSILEITHHFPNKSV